MTLSRLAIAGVLTLAACSSGGEAEPPPPLDTEALSTTVQPTATSEATSTTSTTTTIAETTTTASIEPSVTESAPVESNTVDREAVYADAFSAYETAWATRRAAIRQPNDEELRAAITELYVDNENRAEVLNFIDSINDSEERSVEEAGNPNTVEFLQGGAVTEDQEIAQILVCEVLNDDVVDGDGIATFTEPFSYRLQIFMQLEDGIWKILSEGIDEEFPNEADCE